MSIKKGKTMSDNKSKYQYKATSKGFSIYREGILIDIKEHEDPAHFVQRKKELNDNIECCYKKIKLLQEAEKEFKPGFLDGLIKSQGGIVGCKVFIATYYDRVPAKSPQD